MKRTYSALSAALLGLGMLAFCATGAASERYQYKWRDLDGRLHYSDSLPPTAPQHGYEVVNSRGIVIRRVPRARTAEERAEDAAEAQRVQAEQESAQRQALADRQMLSAYASEEDLVRAQREQLAMLEQGISSAEAGLASLEASLASRLEHAAELEATDKPVPARVTEQIDEMRRQIRVQRVAIQRRSDERDTTTAAFAAQIERYRMLQERRASRDR